MIGGYIEDEKTRSEKLRQDALDQLDAMMKEIDRQTNERIAQQQDIGKRNLAGAGAMSIRAGLSGSSFGDSLLTRTRQNTNKAVNSIREEANAKKGAMRSKTMSALTEIENRAAERLQNLSLQQQELMDNQREEALGNWLDIAKGGETTWDDIEADPELLDEMLAQTGKSKKMLKLLYASAGGGGIKDFKTTITDDGKLISTWYDESTGKVEHQVDDLGLGTTSAKYPNHTFDKDTGALILWNDSGNTIVKYPMGKLGGSSEAGGVNGEYQGDNPALQGLDYMDSELVKGIANYSFPMPTGSALKDKHLRELMTRAKLYDPTFDPTQYGTRQAIRKNFTSGKASNNIRSLNTAIGHLKSLKDAGEDLNNTWLPLVNKGVNLWKEQTGNPQITKFNEAVNAVAGELATVFKGTAGTDTEIKAWKDDISSAQSPEQLKGYVDKAVDLLTSRLMALKQQYETGMGRVPDFSFLNQHSRDLLREMGYNDIAGIDETIPNNVNSNNGQRVINPNDPLDIL
jgi:hypothetical protein